jgi:Na+-transporting NADH:ubiquinone oxidoreductase subunit A
MAGSPVMADKMTPDIMFTSPISGTVEQIVRGEKRKLLAVVIKNDKTQESVDFGAHTVSEMSSDQVKELLLKSGLWPSLIQRPYGVVADPALKPKAIFISAFNTAPLAADIEFVLGDQFQNVQTGINALVKLTEGGVHLSLCSGNYSSTPFHKLENVITHIFSGKHPAGNVGVQISHISPIQKGETVWTISLMMVAAIGKLFNTGKYDLSRKVAVCGPAAIDPAYVDAVPGISMKEISQFFDNTDNDVRFISGDVLSGENVGAEGYLGFFDNQITLIKEGTEREVLGWAKPFRCHLFSSSWTYFSWLTPNKKYDMDTNLHGGVRAFVETREFSKVLPMDLFPIYLIKACLAGDIEKMEQFGIYEVLPEDFALCDYVDPSKNDIQAIIADGIEMMRKEMA